MNKVGDDTSPILYRVRVNDQPATALFDTGASNRTLRGGGGETQPNISTNQTYEINHKFPLPSSVIPIDAVHKFDNKVPCKLKIPLLNTNNNIASITKNTALVSLWLAENVDSIFILDWDTLLQTRQLAVEFNLHLEADKPKPLEISTPNAGVPKKALLELQHLLEAKYSSIVSKSVTDIDRTNIIELDIPTNGPPIACKPYSVLPKVLKTL